MMGDETTEQAISKRQTIPLKSLYLDPNNFRFVDHPEYQPVSADHVFDADVQRRTTGFILGRSQEHVTDLIASIKENGWLDIDPILVQRRDAKRFLVIEGNRRVATLKYLERRYEENAIDLGRLDNALFSKIPVLFYEDMDERHHMVMMGLHHISGKRRWPAVNRALAMKRLNEHFHNDADAVCRALGVSKREFNLSMRTLALVESYKRSDYGDQFQSDQYNLFREVLKSSPMRDWLGWDDTTHTSANTANCYRLFSWMSREEEAEEVEEEGHNIDVRSTPDPVITTGGHIRELAKIIQDPNAVSRLDETRSLQEATLSSTLLVKSEIDGAFVWCDRGVQKLLMRTGELESRDLDRVEQFIGQLQGVALAHKRRPPTTGQRLPRQPFNEITQSQFSSINVESYRGISGLVLDDPGRINLIVGVNNAGKTSLLEAIYLLAHQNDERALLDTIRWRGRVEGEPEPLWLVSQLPQIARISGCFDQVQHNTATFAVEVATEPDQNIENQTSFLSKLDIECSYGGHSQNTDVVFFDDRQRQTNFNGQHWLCRSALTSPFWANRPETLARCNKNSVKAGTKQKIIDFIRERLEPGLHNIELVDRFNRFLVIHDDFDKAPDLATFGEGLRRVFEIGLLFADVRGGVLLIDEFENAIHTELLMEFTRLVHELAIDLNVQVFLATHSKEAVDAWVLNEYQINDIVGYAISRADGGPKVRRYDGSKLLRLHNAVDFDLRGIR